MEGKGTLVERRMRGSQSRRTIVLSKAKTDGEEKHPQNVQATVPIKKM